MFAKSLLAAIAAVAVIPADIEQRASAFDRKQLAKAQAFAASPQTVNSKRPPPTPAAGRHAKTPKVDDAPKKAKPPTKEVCRKEMFFFLKITATGCPRGSLCHHQHKLSNVPKPMFLTAAGLLGSDKAAAITAIGTLP